MTSLLDAICAGGDIDITARASGPGLHGSATTWRAFAFGWLGVPYPLVQEERVQTARPDGVVGVADTPQRKARRIKYGSAGCMPRKTGCGEDRRRRS